MRSTTGIDWASSDGQSLAVLAEKVNGEVRVLLTVSMDDLEPGRLTADELLLRYGIDRVVEDRR